MTEGRASDGVDHSDRAAVIDRLRTDLSATQAQLDLIEQYVHLLLAEAKEQNLIAAATQPVIWSRHILDSAQLLCHVPRGTSRSWIDLGSGAGLPGIVLSILRPSDRFVLVERRPLRVLWLNRVCEALDLQNAKVCGLPVAAIETEKFDVITARAFAPTAKLLALASRFATKDTLWLLPKGKSATEELKAIPPWQGKFHVERSITDIESGIVVGRIDPQAAGRKGGVRG